MSDPLVTSQHSYMDLFNGNAHEKWRAVGMAAQELEVVSVDRPAIALSLQAGQTLLLGRGTLTGTTSSGVSRQHCTLLADHSGHGARLVVLHRAGAAVVRARRNLLNNKDDVSPLILLSAGQSYEVSGPTTAYRILTRLCSGQVLPWPVTWHTTVEHVCHDTADGCRRCGVPGTPRCPTRQRLRAAPPSPGLRTCPPKR